MALKKIPTIVIGKQKISSILCLLPQTALLLHDVGFVVDPDVDRLAIVKDDGEMFVEEYTLVAVADYILQNEKGNTVSNLSSSRALRDVSQRYGVEYNAAAVGEVNVVAKMKETNAIIGGEGNGGVIYPALHYGRDALVGYGIIHFHFRQVLSLNHNTINGWVWV